MQDRGAKDHLYDGFALIGKALANGRRLEILDLLAQASLPVEDIAVQIDQTEANTSQHLRVLASSGLVSSRRRGRQVVYSIAPGSAQLLQSIRRLALDQIETVEHLVSDYLGPRDDIEWLTRAELRRRLRNGTVVVIDVRPRSDFEAGHIPGALAIPLDELADRFGEVPRGTDVVAYCRGPFCALGDAAVRWLRGRGVRALRLEDGFPEWAREELRV